MVQPGIFLQIDESWPLLSEHRGIIADLTTVVLYVNTAQSRKRQGLQIDLQTK
jgi:hypothetical protein